MLDDHEDFNKLEEYLRDIYAEIIKFSTINVVDYIPQLAKVNLDLFAISLSNMNGSLINIGYHI